MKTPTHLSIGEEAIAAGICAALHAKDQLFGTYRGHGIYLARTQETQKFFLELFGKEGGIADGKTGSMHLSAIEDGLMGTSAVVGTTLPVAVGAAFANKVQQNGKVVAIFFGDGAIEEGVFWESLNVACLKQLPILFICEDNGLAIHTPKSQRQGFKSLCNIIRQFSCEVIHEKSTDPEIIYQLGRHALDHTLSTQQPTFLHLEYYRYYEHVGVYEDFKFNYRPKDEFLKWYAQDPVLLQRQKLLNLTILEAELASLERKIQQQVDESFENAQRSSFPTAEKLYEHIYA